MNIQDVNNDGIGMDGFDPVAHFEGNPLRGEAQFSFSIGDITYHFANAENMQRFQEEPGKYIPIAGGIPTGTRVAPPNIQQDGDKYVGNKNYEYRRNLEDAKVSNENNVPTDIKEDGSVEMQNLHDNEA
jgi:YHS domain-containing protein